MNNMQSKGIKCALALGTFDGMHAGHVAVISEAVKWARLHNVCCIVYTFKNHPRSVFGEAPKMIMSISERCNKIKSLGVDKIDIVTFDKELCHKSPDAFIRDLVNEYNVSCIIAGSD